MQLLVNKKYYDFSEMTNHRKYLLMRGWHKKSKIACLCNGNTNPPLLMVVKRNKKLFFRNYRTNYQHGRFHTFHCPFNQKGYQQQLRKVGIDIDDDGAIKCSLKKPSFTDKPSEISLGKQMTVQGSGMSKSKSALRWLFLTMFKYYGSDEYIPGQKRNIHHRLLSVAKQTYVDQSNLSQRTFVCTNQFKKPRPDHHQMYIFWGDIKNHRVQEDRKYDFLVRMPILATDTQQKVSDITILKSIYEKATYLRADVNTGYWILWREKKGGRFKDSQLIFVAACPVTGIPVESSYEQKMIHYLVSNERQFLKPVVGNITEMFLDLRPDMLLKDTYPYTVIEVAGMNHSDYHKRLNEKRVVYESRDYQYIEWDGDGTICLPKKEVTYGDR